MKEIKKVLFIIGGGISLFLAGIGIVANFIPFIPFPTTPFLLLASFCFSKGSDRFDTWFKGTKMYEKYLADYVQTHSMTWKQKATILAVASFGLLIPFILVDVLPMRIFLFFIAICKYVYFIFAIRTIKESKFCKSQKEVLPVD